ncbi:MAG: FecR family protein [Fermentimonas sp.]|nr:FecR family protein [Fermentimonas sp.]
MPSELSSPNEHDSLIFKYLEDEVMSVQEKKLLKEWILESKDNENYFRNFAFTWEASNIVLQDENKVKVKLEEFDKKQRRHRNHKLIRLATGSVAAVILLLITLQLFTPYQLIGGGVQTFTTDNNKKEIVLPDGSQVWLNAQSSISYSKNFNKSRKVKLTGEALFDVVKSEGKNFTVETPKILIEVLGTTFLVNDRVDSDIAQTVLESGAVNIKINDSDFNLNIKPNELFEFNSVDGSSILETVNASSYTGWIEDNLSFANIPVNELIIHLEKWYNIDIVCNNSEILDTPVSITIDEEPLEETLFLLSQIIPLTWSEGSGKTIILN